MGIATIESIEGLYLSSPETEDRAFSQMSCLPGLESMVLNGSITGDGLAYVSKCESLEYLRLDNRTVADQHLEHLSRLENLDLLAIRCPEVTDEGLRHLGAIPNLRLLHLWECTQVNGSGLGYLGQIENLNLQGPSVNDETLVHLHELNPSPTWRDSA